MTAGQVVAPEWGQLREHAGRLGHVERELLTRAAELRSAVGFVAGVDANVQSAMSSALYKLEGAATSAGTVARKVNAWAEEIVACDGRLQTGNVPTVRPLGSENAALTGLGAMGTAAWLTYRRSSPWIQGFMALGLPEDLTGAQRVIRWQIARLGGLPLSAAGRANLTYLKSRAAILSAAAARADDGHFGRLRDAGLRTPAAKLLIRNGTRVNAGRKYLAGLKFTPVFNVVGAPVSLWDMGKAYQKGEGRTIATVEAAAAVASAGGTIMLAAGVTTFTAAGVVVSAPVLLTVGAVVGTGVVLYRYGPKIWNVGSAAVGDARAAVAGAAGTAAREVGDALDDAGDAVGDALDDAGDAVGDAADDARDAVEDAADDARGAAGDAAKRAGSTVRRGWRSLGF